MRQLIELENIGFTFVVTDGKLKYDFKGKGLINDSAVGLLNEIKENKDAVILFLRSRYQETNDAIQQAWDGTLKRAVLIECKPEYQALWRGPVWLCPNDDSKAQILKRYPNRLALTAKEFFDICKIVSESGQAAAMPVIEAARLFGGQIIEEAGK